VFGLPTFEKMNRKEFLKTGGRFLMLGGMAASTGYLIFNKQVKAECTVSPTCKNCIKLSDCEKPEVKKERYGKE
jgi:hypothetical protein